MSAAEAAERCTECGGPVTCAGRPVRAPKDHPDLTGTLMCQRCAKKEGFPTAADLGLCRRTRRSRGRRG